jgi:hypothetical protein
MQNDEPLPTPEPERVNVKSQHSYLITGLVVFAVTFILMFFLGITAFRSFKVGLVWALGWASWVLGLALHQRTLYCALGIVVGSALLLWFLILVRIPITGQIPW